MTGDDMRLDVWRRPSADYQAIETKFRLLRPHLALEGADHRPITRPLKHQFNSDDFNQYGLAQTIGRLPGH